jgi:putative spermidine/putrescine transport system ATP-binding protein
MTMADMVVVMGPDNRVHQVGSPLEIYRHPSDTFVADFIGSSNLLRGSCTGSLEVEIGDRHLVVENIPPGVTAGTPVTVSVRPEDIHVVPGAEKGDNRLHGTVSFIRDVGSSVEIYIDCIGLRIISQSTPKGRPDVKQGEEATAILPATSCIVLRS